MCSQLLPKTTLTRMPHPTLHLLTIMGIVSVMEFPKTDIPGDNLAIQPINKQDGYDLTSIPSSYSIVPQVYQRKEPLYPQVLTFQRTVHGLAEDFNQALIEEYRWLETVVETHRIESIILSWIL